MLYLKCRQGENTLLNISTLAKNILLGLQWNEGLLLLDCWLHSWFFCTTGQVEFGWFSKLVSGIVGTHLPCWQIFAPPNSVRHSSEAWCIICAWICVWTAVPGTWQQLFLELSSSKTNFSKWHSRLDLHEFFSFPGAQIGLCRTHQLLSSQVLRSGNPSWQTFAVLFVHDRVRKLCNHPRITSLQICG